MDVALFVLAVVLAEVWDGLKAFAWVQLRAYPMVHSMLGLTLGEK